MESDGEATRSALIRAAEQLMARQGIDGVDLKDIQLAAGQRNRSAINYHFKDRTGLVRAIGDKHRLVINAERHRMLDRLEMGGTVSANGLVEALVLPLAASLDDPSGRDYLVILAQATPQVGTTGLFRPAREHLDSIQRLNAMLLELLDGSPSVRRLRISQAVLVVPVLLADIARDLDADALTTGQARRRVREVVAFVVGALRVAG